MGGSSPITPSPVRDLSSLRDNTDTANACQPLQTLPEHLPPDMERVGTASDAKSDATEFILVTSAVCALRDHTLPEIQQTPGQMVETIRRLKERIEQLELLLPPDPESIYLNQPYLTPVSSGTPEPVLELETPSIPEASLSFGLPEPSSDLIATLVDVFKMPY
ncbi:hypothetical protein FB451DRAFT_1192836 [Mycena latifolia]|nr:hypothetical protein FB451DRAFT_1192836 [Mycena latifolia]